MQEHSGRVNVNIKISAKILIKYDFPVIVTTLSRGDFNIKPVINQYGVLIIRRISFIIGTYEVLMMNYRIYDIAVIGAGAGGLSCCIAAKKRDGGASVVLLENKDRVGKKILATGNGKCNLSNLNENTVGNYYSPDLSFVNTVLSKYTNKSNIEFFGEIGLVCRADSEGRVYPFSAYAGSVCDALRYECDRLGVETLCNFKTKGVTLRGGIFEIVSADGQIVRAKNAVIATGGRSYDGEVGVSGYEILKSFGHKINKTYPSLVPLKTEKPKKQLKGLRVLAKASLYCDSEFIKSEMGEIQFTDYGLSGIAIMQLSGIVSRTLADAGEKHFEIRLDLMPEYSKEQVESIISERILKRPDESADELLSGVFRRAISAAIVDETPGYARESKPDLMQIKYIANTVKSFRFKVVGTAGFANAQVTGGGADTLEFDPNTMESKIVKGLYACGEILDVQGVCGGFNLNWAWSSGRLAGVSAAERKNKDVKNK